MASNTETTHLWTMIYQCLTGDATLVAALGHTAAAPHIGRIWQRSSLNDPSIVFGQKVLSPLADNDQPRILTLRNVYVDLLSLSIASDAIASENMDYALEAIVGEVLSYSGYKTNPIEWDSFQSPPYYDEDEKKYRVDARLKIIIKECN